MKIYDDTFIAEINKILETHCVNGATLKTEDLCTNLQLDSKKFRPIISSVFHMNLLPDYTIYPGPGRGIGRVDTPPAKKTPTTTTQEIPEEFTNELKELLPQLCAGGVTISRKYVVSKMTNVPEKTYKAENWVSQLLKTDEFSNFTAIAGRFGGIKMIDIQSSPSSEDSSVPTESDISEEMSEEFLTSSLDQEDVENIFEH